MPELTPEEIVWAYCANEMYSGYPCGTEGCPYCGGPEGVEKTKAEIASYFNRHRSYFTRFVSPLRYRGCLG